jgi:cellulose binding protein with CBM2 domain/fibronectin type III domain protein
MPTARLRRAAFVTTILATTIPLAASLSTVPTVAAEPPPDTTVTVNARAGLATMPTTGLGINHAVWDTNLGTTQTTDLLGAAGVKMMRYPGGSYGDIYHWESHTAPGGYVAPNTDFDTFMSGVERAGAQAMVIANYGTGSPEEAAGWVRQANVVKGYGVKYWEIGNELYGNGHYGAQWEADDHADKSPTGYATEVVNFSRAMKAVDPTIKVGAVLTTPANWPDGVVAEGDPATWNRTVLSIAGPHVDFVILHWYPGGGTAAETFAKPQQIKDMIYVVRAQIAKYAGTNAGRLGIALTEINTSVGRNTQPGALFAAESYASLLEQGVFSVQWWNTHNGIGTVSEVAGHTDYDDFGLLSSGVCNENNVCEPELNTPFAPYYALKTLSLYARPGDQFVRAGSDRETVTAHAARRPNGDLAVLLVNQDPDNAHQVAIDYAGYTPAASAPTVHTFVNGGTAVTTGQTGTATSQTLPPYSLTTLVLRPARATTGAPGTPGQPAVSAVTDTSATLSWPAAKPGAKPIAKYEIHLHNTTTSEQWGETPGTSFTAHNLNPGSRYTVNVLARDTAGAVSWASPPLTITTGTPAASACSVRFTDTTNWGSGFVANVDITNQDTRAVNGWTLTFRWPTTLQRVDSGWNGTWTQSGTTVTVTNADSNAVIEPGASASVGFVGAYSGPNILPLSYTLNGIVCTTT